VVSQKTEAIKQTNKMQKQEPIYANGFVGKRFENDPDFLVLRLSITKNDAIAFINKHANADGWVNLEVKKGREAGKFNITLNTYQGGKTDYKKPEKKFEPTNEVPF
jgi:hypothetical protein